MSDKSYHDIDGNPTTLEKVVRADPGWAISRIKTLQAECIDLQTKLDKVTDGLAEHLDLEFGAEIERLRTIIGRAIRRGKRPAWDIEGTLDDVLNILQAGVETDASNT